MTEAQVIDVMRQHLEGKFPKKCGVCDRTYANLKDYLLHTTHVGQPRSYDVELDNFRPTQPIGTMSLANCSCGNTLVMDSTGMSLSTLWRLMGWLSCEMIRRRQKAPVVLEDLRRAIDQATLAAPAAHGDAGAHPGHAPIDGQCDALPDIRPDPGSGPPVSFSAV